MITMEFHYIQQRQNISYCGAYFFLFQGPQQKSLFRNNKNCILKIQDIRNKVLKDLYSYVNVTPSKNNCKLNISLTRKAKIYVGTELKYQLSGKGGTRSPPSTPHCLQHLTACFIHNGGRGLEIIKFIYAIVNGSQTMTSD